MKRVLIGLILCLCAALPAWAGDPVSDFTLKDTNGRSVHLSDYLGENVIVINFWATWCGPCQNELPQLERIWEKYKDGGLMILSIATDGPSSAARVKPNAKKLGLTFPVLLDRESVVSSRLNPRNQMPYTLIVGKDKTIAHVHEGYTAGDEQKLDNEIAALLGSEATP